VGAAGKIEATQTRIRQIAGSVILPRWEKIRSEETRLFRFLIVVSAAAHLGVTVINPDMFSMRSPVIEEWTIDADLFSDFDVGAPLKSALPDAKEAPEAKVSDRMLPQLPKQFTIDQPPPTAEKTFEENVEKKPEAAPEATKVEPAVEPKAETPPPPAVDEEKNRLEAEEARKRMVLEKLRREDKVAKQNEAEEKENLARIAEIAAQARNRNSGSTTGVTQRSAFRRYEGALQSAIRKNYSIPEASSLKGLDITVIITMRVSERGDLLDIKIEESSSDALFDEEALRAVRASVPLPPPPQELVGEVIRMRFSPRTM